MEQQVLTIKQMKHLHKLCLDTSNASMVLIYTDSYENVVDWDVVIEEIKHPEPEIFTQHLYDAETGDYNKFLRKKYGVFTLQDILNLLPHKIDDGDVLIQYLDLCLFEGKWMVSYKYYNSDKEFVSFDDKSVLNACFKLLCWCIEQGYVVKQ